MSAARAASQLSSKGRVVHSSGTGSYTVDFGTLPVLEVTYTGTVDDAAFRAYLDSLVSVLATKQPYVLLADASASGAPSARQRQMQADVIRDHRDGFAKYCRGAAFVIQSAVVRGALTAILWIQPLPYEHKVVSNRRDALEFLRPRVA